MADVTHGYQRCTLDGLIRAVERGDRSAREALKQYIRLATDYRIVEVIIERHDRQGWRSRGIPAGRAPLTYSIGRD